MLKCQDTTDIPYIDSSINTVRKSRFARFSFHSKVLFQLNQDNLTTNGLSSEQNSHQTKLVLTSDTDTAHVYLQYLRVYCCEWACQWEIFRKFQVCNLICSAIAYSSAQALVAVFILDAFVELFITICIVLNTLFMALDQPGQSEKMSRILTIGNYIFTSIFTVESILKIIALTPGKFYRNGWNVFDFLIVTVSLIELGLANVKGLSVLRSFRLVSYLVLQFLYNPMI